MNPVEVTQDLSIVSLVLHASLLVQFVMGLLLVMSLFSWTYIFRKAFALRAARSQTESFERDFWAGGDLQALYQSAANNRHSGCDFDDSMPVSRLSTDFSPIRSKAIISSR